MPLDNELRLVSRLVRDRDITPALERGITLDWFQNDDARTYWQHLLRHWQKYSETPSVNALKNSFPGSSWPRIEDTAEYLIDEFVAYRRRKETIRLVQDAAEIIEDANDHEAALARMATGLAQIGDTGDNLSRDIQLTDHLDDRVQRYLDLEGAFEGGLRGLPTGFPTIDKATSGLQKQQLVTIIAPPKTGKAQSVESAILTPGGWMRMGDVAPGDSVVGSDGRPTLVVATQRWQDRPLMRIATDDGGSVVVDAEHDWTVHPHGSFPRTVSTAELGRRISTDRRFGYLPVVSPVQYDAGKPLLIDPYLLGVLLGDGCVLGGSPTVCKPDDWLHDEIRRRLPAGAQHRWVDEARGMARLVGNECANPVTASLRELGVWGRRSFDKLIPSPYLVASIEERRMLLAGLLDTDGGVEGKNITFCSTSQMLAGQVQQLVWSLGGTARIKHKPTPRFQGGGVGRPAWVVTLRFGYCPFRLPRKAEAWAARGVANPRGATRRVVSVEPAGRGETVCIQVAAPDGLYVTQDFLVTHNSTLALVIADYIHQHPKKHPMFIGFEMSNDEQEARWLARRARISHGRMLSGRLKREEKLRLRALKHQSDGEMPPFTLSDAASASTVSGIAAKIEKHKPDIVFIDGVYLMLDEVTGEANTPQAITNNTRALKRLAQRFDIPIVISTQVLLWKMSKKTGVTADSIGYSSSFYQDSDVILGLQRTDADDDDQRILRVVASRNCGPEEVPVIWDWETGDFSEPTAQLVGAGARLYDDDDDLGG